MSRELKDLEESIERLEDSLFWDRALLVLIAVVVVGKEVMG